MMLLPDGDRPKEAIGFVVQPGGEEEGVGWTGVATVAKAQPPEAIIHDGVAVLVAQLAQEGAGGGVESVDAAIAKVADEQRVAELAEIGRRQRQSPGGVQRLFRCKALDEFPCGAEDIHKAVPWPGDIIMPVFILAGVGDVEVAANVGNAKGGVIGWQREVFKDIAFVWLGNQMEVGVVDINAVVVEVGGIEEVVPFDACQRQPFVDGGTGIGGGEDGIVAVYGWTPGSNRAVFGGEDEERRARFAVLRDDKIARPIKDDAGGRTGCRGAIRPRDAYHQGRIGREGHARAVVEGGDVGAIVGNPEGRRGASYDAPGIEQMGVNEFWRAAGRVGEVGDEIGLHVEAAGRLNARAHPCRSGEKGDGERQGQRERHACNTRTPGEEMGLHSLSLPFLFVQSIDTYV